YASSPAASQAIAHAERVPSQALRLLARLATRPLDGGQFRCDCGWRSALPASFVAEYRAKWGLGA
ncbi:hypothetical protein, partial [Rubellimicrobium rubrum]|uniref:hypothetical protein n=1 Tax=Rubellimicrobium rubrum TaxID=2585369 RepID=UPI001C3F4191